MRSNSCPITRDATVESHSPESNLNRPRLVSLILALITLLVYLPVRHHGFVLFDDPDYVTENRTVQAGLTWSGVEWAFTSGHASNWHPLTWLSHMLDCELFGPNAGAQHLVNVLFHVTNSVLLFWVLFRMTGALWPGAFVAALFAWHPLHVESVAWIAERKDVLSTFFGLLALLMYERYVASSKVQLATPERSEGGSPKSKVFYGVALLFFALGLMSKPMLVTLPFVLLLLDYWPLNRMSGVATSNALRLAREKWPFFLLAAASCVVTFLAQRAEAVLTLDRHPLDLRIKNAVVSCVSYLLKTIWPTDLAVIYPLPNQIPWAQTILAASVLAAISWCLWRARRQKPFLVVGWLWYLGTLVPVIGLVQVGGQAMADRYTYIPLIGVFIALAYGGANLLARLRFKPVTAAIFAGLVLLGCLFATNRQLRYWRNSETLFAHAVAVTHDNAIAHINLGVAFEQQGRRDEALVQYQTALRLDPGRVQVHNNLANLLDELGQTNEALIHYREALRLKPDAPLARDNFGMLLIQLGRFDEAMSHYAEAARLDPTDPQPHYLMGKAQLRQGHSVEAIAHFRDALRRDENDFKTLTLLARVLASDENPQLRNGPEAVALAQRADALTGGEQPFVLDTLAMAFAETGHFDEAQRTIRKAIELSTAAGVKDNVSDMEQRLKLYQSGLPYREAFTNTPPKSSP
jgi:protein O-mannosyl-transferase